MCVYNTECNAPSIKSYLTILVVTRLVVDAYVEGDNITYECTGDGETDDDVISVCNDDGQWSLQTLPTCCESIWRCDHSTACCIDKAQEIRRLEKFPLKLELYDLIPTLIFISLFYSPIILISLYINH